MTAAAYASRPASTRPSMSSRTRRTRRRRSSRSTSACARAAAPAWAPARPAPWTQKGFKDEQIYAMIDAALEDDAQETGGEVMSTEAHGHKQWTCDWGRVRAEDTRLLLQLVLLRRGRPGRGQQAADAAALQGDQGHVLREGRPRVRPAGVPEGRGRRARRWAATRRTATTSEGTTGPAGGSPC